MITADLLVILHLVFIVFVITGGFLALRWPRLIWAHVPCALWGATIEFTGWICPLTPLENRLRRAAGAQGYEGGFIDHYIVPVVYPAGLTHDMQVWLGFGVVVLNLVAYGLLWRQRRRRRSAR
jgi:hypothetical protein